MKWLFTIVLFIFCSSSYAQYVVHWELSYKNGINNFEVQQSKDNNFWTPISTVAPSDTLIYNDTLNLSENNYYRVAAKMNQNVFYSNSILISSVLPVIMSDVKFTHIKIKK